MNSMEKSIHIGLFVDTFYPMIDGVVTVVDNYARRLAEYADVTVFAPESRDLYRSFDDVSKEVYQRYLELISQKSNRKHLPRKD